MTILRWAGSKRQLAPTLANYWYASDSGVPRTYFEGFTGSGVVHSFIAPGRAVLVDVNRELTDCLSVVRDSPESLAKLVARAPCDEQSYYRIRDIDPRCLTKVQRAARFIYLNRLCFNGLYRTNRQGRFNVPFGGVRNGVLPSSVEIRRWSNALASAVIVQDDFSSAILTRVRPGDFVYLDPPYAERNNRIDQQYGPDVFGLRDIERLSELLVRLNDLRATFVLSYAKCDAILKRTKGWSVQTAKVRRTIAAASTSRGMSTELLISNL